MPSTVLSTLHTQFDVILSRLYKEIEDLER